MVKNRDVIKDVTPLLPDRISYRINNLPQLIKDSIQEIRLRSNKPVILECSQNKTYYLTDKSHTEEFFTNINYILSYKNDLTEIFSKACIYSVYNRQNEISKGFVTIAGGHRMGITGTAVYNNGELINVKDITSLNIRISREFINCSKDLFSKLKEDFSSLLICGKPSSGKTTLIRDIARKLSVDYSKKVCVIDSRNEISATYRGEITNDLGTCDVFSQYQKTEAIVQAVRNMSPDFIVCDEIVIAQEINAISQGVNTGVNFIVTVHCSSVEELMNKPLFKNLLSLNAFENAVILKDRDAPCQIDRIINIKDFTVNNAN
ncbi:MAG: Flp pilus assembly complex ATPase component TadA [Oscillospiraceae bacterium]|nr:Flp pilus assembly complex ATPase component TadA [Oscillospiraceae bacterium]